MELEDKYQEAIKNLELPQKFSLKILKKNYRRKVKEEHPDKTNLDKNNIQKIKESYDILLEYIENYEISFDKKNIQTNPNEFMRKKIMEEWSTRL